MILSLIAAIILGLGIAYFAIQNLHQITITLANYPVSIPVYVLVIGSILIGLFVSFIFSLIDSFSSRMALHGKDASLQKAKQTIRALQQENQRLRVENAQYSRPKPIKDVKDGQPRYSVFDQLRGTS